MALVFAHDLLEKHQIGRGAAHRFAQFRQDEAPIEGGEALVGIDRQHAQAMNDGGVDGVTLGIAGHVHSSEKTASCSCDWSVRGQFLPDASGRNTNHPSRQKTGGSEPACESGLPIDQSLTECTRSNCGSWLASDDGSQADQPPTECKHSNCGSEPARESGLPDKIKTTEQTPHINITAQPRLKYTNRYAIPATTPCAVTYAYARIRRLTRLCVGLIVSLSLENSDRVW